MYSVIPDEANNKQLEIHVEKHNIRLVIWHNGEKLEFSMNPAIFEFFVSLAEDAKKQLADQMKEYD